MTRQTFTRIITLTGFLLLIGVFIYYRTGGFNQYLTSDNNAPDPITTSNTTMPAGPTGNTAVAAALDNSLALASGDTTKPFSIDSASIKKNLNDLKTTRMMSSSKSIVVLEEDERAFKRFRKLFEKDSLKQARRLQDSLRKQLYYHKVGTPPVYQAPRADTSKPRQ